MKLLAKCIGGVGNTLMILAGFGFSLCLLYVGFAGEDIGRVSFPGNAWIGCSGLMLFGCMVKIVSLAMGD